nr:cobalamin-dependent protein [Tissierella sp.]
MGSIYKPFLKALQEHDKERAMSICLDSLENKTIDLITLYESILTRALNAIIEEFEEEEMLIWQEHVRSSIILSIIENCYSYILEESRLQGLKKKERVIVLCPQYEEHLIGARMVQDIFTLSGYDSTFIGANTPWRTILKAIEVIKPEIISISVTNFYNTIEAKRTIEMIKEFAGYEIKFVLGGYAFSKEKDLYKEVGGDLHIQYLGDIFAVEELLKEEVKVQ